ncbi:MAG: peptide ABC transporter substrate-binding protein [Pseudomonadota bacterium]
MRLIFLFSLMIALTACDKATDDGVSPGPEQIVRLSDSEIKGLDPQAVSDLSSLRVAADQFEGLTRLNGRGEAEPGLAKSWTVSPDGLQWVFELKQGRTFSDATPIDTQLFPAILNRLRSEDTAAPAKALFDNISAITALSDQDVEIRLKSPSPALPTLLAHPALSTIPLHRIKEAGDGWTADRPMVTSGPYRLTRWLLNNHLRLERNPNWHDNSGITRNIVWKPMDDSLSGMRLVLAGGADIASDYPVSRHQWLDENHPGLARSTPYLGSYYYAFNTRKPPFDDRRVRIALSMAVERQWIAATVMAVGNIPSWSVLPPRLNGTIAYRPQWASWSREERLREANRLLREAGYDKDNPLTFEMRFNSSAEHRRVSVALAAMWQPLHVRASLFNSEAALHFAALRQHDFALARSGWIADIPVPENFLTVHQPANGSGNYSGYDNPAYDKLIADALQSADAEKRQQLFDRANQMLTEDMPILPLYFYVTRSLVGPRIEGWEDNISNVHPSRTLRIRTP